MNVLVTGGAGFIGSHLCDLLLEKGHRVIAVDNLSTGRHRNIEHLLQRQDFEFVLGSILNADLMDDVAARVDSIYHLAAAVGVELIVEKPLESLATNIRGSEVVFEKAHKYGCSVLVTSTSEIYGKNTSDRLHEDDDRILGSPLKSRWSYSEAKAIDEILAYTYWKEKALPTVIVRLFNTVGPRQTGSYGMVIPRFVSQAIRNDALTVYGDGRQTRDWLHAQDHCAAIDLVLREGQPGEAYNVGGGEEVENVEITRRILGLTGRDESLVRHVADRPGHDRRYSLDSSKVRSLGWSPRRTLADGLAETVAWHRERRDWWEPLKSGEYRAYYERQYAERLG